MNSAPLHPDDRALLEKVDVYLSRLIEQFDLVAAVDQDTKFTRELRDRAATICNAAKDRLARAR